VERKSAETTRVYADGDADRRRQVLVVEPDELTGWSLKTYLGKWFSVHSTNSPENAERVLEAHPVDVLVVSDELPTNVITALRRRAARHNANVNLVRTVTDPDRLGESDLAEGACLEKPFALAQLARLLGIPEEEIPGE
jgi:DNA-binding response OmpR family regulator